MLLLNKVAIITGGAREELEEGLPSNLQRKIVP